MSRSEFKNPNPSMETLGCRYRPWPDLPDPLLEIILECLPLSDYVRFSAVCRRWRSVQTSHRRLHFPSPPPMLRLLWLIPYRPPYEEETLSQVRGGLSCYSPFEDRSFTVSLPSSSLSESFAHGWVFSRDSANLVLWNPISCARIELPLPPRIDRPGTFTISPPPNYIVSYTDAFKVSLLRWFDWSWVELEISGLMLPYADIVSCGRKHYCISFFYSNARWKYSHNLLVVDALATPPTFQFHKMVGRSRMTRKKGCTMPKRSECRHGVTFFVEFDGEPLLVKEIVRNDGREMTVGFEVLRADLGTKMWVRVESIGDRVIMLRGDRYDEWSVSLLASDVGGKGNCIYFSTRSIRSAEESGEASWKVFDLGTGMVTDLLLPNASQIKKCHQRLFVPSLC